MREVEIVLSIAAMAWLLYIALRIEWLACHPGIRWTLLPRLRR